MDYKMFEYFFYSYEILHTFELPQPTHAFDWSSDGNGKNVRAYSAKQL